MITEHKVCIFYLLVSRGDIYAFIQFSVTLSVFHTYEIHLIILFHVLVCVQYDRSESSVSLGDWHRILISRTSRLISIKVDNQPPVMALTPGAFTQVIHQNK